MPTDLSFVHGPVTSDGTVGVVTVFEYTIYPFGQPTNFEANWRDRRHRFTTDGVKLLTDAAGGSARPWLVRANYGLFSSLLIAPQGLRVSEVLSLRYNATGERLILELPEDRFGLVAGSAIVFMENHPRGVTFQDVEELVEDMPQF